MSTWETAPSNTSLLVLVLGIADAGPAAEEVPPAGLRQLIQRDRLAPELGPVPDPRHVATGPHVEQEHERVVGLAGHSHVKAVPHHDEVAARREGGERQGGEGGLGLDAVKLWVAI